MQLDEYVNIGISNEVPGVSGVVNTFDVSNDLDAYFVEIASKINLKDLNGWRLSINIVLASTDGIGIFKKISRYPSDNEYELRITVMVPLPSQAPYGIDQKLGAFYRPLVREKFHMLDLNLGHYTNLRDYIYDAGVKAINEAFGRGFVCGGVKIRFQEAV